MTYDVDLTATYGNRAVAKDFGPRQYKPRGQIEVDFTDEIFNDHVAAIDYLEGLRWPIGKICPDCGSGDITKFKGGDIKSGNGSHRYGLCQCNECRCHFSVTSGTVLHRRHLPAHILLRACWLYSETDGKINAFRLSRELDITYVSAYSLHGKLKEAAKP